VVLLAVSGKLCYDTKDVPDAVNEAKSIVIGDERFLYSTIEAFVPNLRFYDPLPSLKSFLAIFSIMVVCTCGFAVAMATTNLESFYIDFVLGVCFFVACTASMMAYFGPKLSLLLKGADLNAQFRIVLRKKSVGNKIVVTAAGSRGEFESSDSTHDENADRSLRKSVLALYLQENPKTSEHCQIIIDHLHELMFQLDFASDAGTAASAHSHHAPSMHSLGHSDSFRNLRTINSTDQHHPVHPSPSRMDSQPVVFVAHAASQSFVGNT
jgi:hypothetical protein